MTRRAVDRCRCAALLALLVLGPQGMAGEGGYSNYIPGFYGDLALAVAPPEGWSIRNDFYLYDADGAGSVRSGQIEFEADLSLRYNYLTALYNTGREFLGADLALGVTASIGHSDIDASLAAGADTIAATDDRLGFGDPTLASYLYWAHEKFHVFWAGYIVAPTGRYDVDNLANIGLNYWTLETDVALTYFDEETGRDWSVIVGYGYNFENDDTRYKTGDEVHLDFVLNQFLSDSFALGINGFFYRQIGGDSGPGAVLGAFKGEAAGIGPAVYWRRTVGERDVFFSVKWLHEFDVENRLTGDHVYASFSLSL